MPTSMPEGDMPSSMLAQAEADEADSTLLLLAGVDSQLYNFEEQNLTALPAVKSLCWSCKVLAILVYSTLSIVAFVGNALILAVFLRFKRLRTPTHMLIANLAIGDLMISIFCIPLSYWHVLIFVDQRWVFGAFLCKMFNYLQATAVFLSSWTLVAISFDRFMAIQFAMSPWLKMDRRRAFYAIIGTWAFSLGMALPLLLVNELESSPEGVDTCLEKWDASFSAKFVSLYTSSLFALQYCLPLAVLLITYTAIGLKMWNSKVPGEEFCTAQPQKQKQEMPILTDSGPGTKARGSTVSASFNGTQLMHQQSQRASSQVVGPGGGSATIRRKSSHGGTVHVNVNQERKESVKKLIPMVLLVSALYAVCWLPQNLLMNIWVVYDATALNHPYILYIWWGAHTLAMSHSVVNPFVYYATNRRIHAALKYLLRWLPCLKNARNCALAEFDQLARRRAMTSSSFRMPSEQRRSTLQKTISLSVE